jgi:hypothetical protein
MQATAPSKPWKMQKINQRKEKECKKSEAKERRDTKEA